MAKIKIGWCSYNHCWPKAVEQEYASLFSEFALAPARLSETLKREQGDFWNDCPAYNNFISNVFAVFAPFPLKWKVSDDGSGISSTIRNPDKLSDVPFHFSEAFFDYAKIRTQQKLLGLGDRIPELPIFDFRMHTLFVSNRPNTWVDLMPAFLHDTSRLNVRPIPGSFNINAWPRPTVFAGPLLDGAKAVEMERGDALYYVRFRTEDPADSFELVPIRFTERLRQAVTARVNYKTLFPLQSWRLMQSLDPVHDWFDEGRS
jgi:hypothetical protein